MSKLSVDGSRDSGTTGSRAGATPSGKEQLESSVVAAMSKHEWGQACAAATRDIEVAVAGINDALLELRYEAAELQGGEA